MDSNELQEKIDLIADQLIEHGDSVVILISSSESDTGSFLQYAYRGNYHTVLGSMEHFKACRLAQRVVDGVKE